MRKQASKFCTQRHPSVMSGWQSAAPSSWQGGGWGASSGWGGWHKASDGASQGKRVWQCSVCKASNYSKATCATCGCRRTWSDVAQSGNANHASQPRSGMGRSPAAPPGDPTASRSQGQTTREQLNQLTASLASATSLALAPTPVSAKSIGVADQKEVKATIKQTEATLAATHECDTEIRDILTARLVALKATLEDARPVGARLDQARAATARARSRLADAVAAEEAARALQIVANAEILAGERDVAELERQLALQSTVAATPTATVPAETGASTMDQVQRLLSSLIKTLSDDPFVPAEQVTHATTHVTDLLKGFQRVAHEAQTMKQAAAAAALFRVESTSSAATCIGRAPRLGEPDAPTERHFKKSPPKRLITDHFRTDKKTRSSSCRSRARTRSPAMSE